MYTYWPLYAAQIDNVGSCRRSSRCFSVVVTERYRRYAIAAVIYLSIYMYIALIRNSR